MYFVPGSEVVGFVIDEEVCVGFDIGHIVEGDFKIV